MQTTRFIWRREASCKAGLGFGLRSLPFIAQEVAYRGLGPFPSDLRVSFFGMHRTVGKLGPGVLRIEDHLVAFDVMVTFDL